MTLRIIGLTGKAGAGKDTVADYMVEEHGYIKYSLAQPIKAALNAMFDFHPDYWLDRDWKETPRPELDGKSPRYLAQTLGTEWGREKICDDLWLRLAEKAVDEADVALFAGHYNYVGVVIPDIRFENEARWIRESMDGQLWHVHRDVSDLTNTHRSEDGVQFKKGDCALLNYQSIDHLQRAVDKFLSVGRVDQ